MKIKVFLTALTFLFLTTAYSQIGIKGGFNLGTRVELGTGLYTGFDLGLTYDITESIRGEILFEGLFKSDYLVAFPGSNYHINYRIIPITVGVDYRLLKGKIQPYAGLNLGVMSFAVKTNAGSYKGNSYFEIHPKVGVNIQITDRILIDAALKYHIAFNASSLQNNKNTQIFGANIGLIYVF